MKRGKASYRVSAGKERGSWLPAEKVYWAAADPEEEDGGETLKGRLGEENAQCRPNVVEGL